MHRSALPTPAFLFLLSKTDTGQTLTQALHPLQDFALTEGGIFISRRIFVLKGLQYSLQSCS
jgi:hypothetical protein